MNEPPLIVQTDPRPAVELLDGHVAAAPGGIVRFLDDAETEALLREHVQQIAAASGHEGAVQERLFGALQEFAYTALEFGKTHKAVYSQLTSDNPIDLTRYQLANCYVGRAGLINSGGASSGEGDVKEAVRTAVINKRAGGMGLISGRKAFQRPMKEGAALLNAIQDVYLTKEVTIA